MSDATNVDIAALLSNPDSAAEILKQLSGDPDKLRKVIEEGRKVLRESKKSETSEEDAEKREQLRPFQEQLEIAEQDFAAFKKQWDDQLSQVKEDRKKALDLAQVEVDKVKDAYNQEREKLGLKTNRTASVGPTINWHVKILDINEKTAEIGLKDQPETYVTTTLNDKGSVPSKWVRQNIVEKNSVIDPNGGRLRGLLTKIKGAFANAIADGSGGTEDNIPDSTPVSAPEAEVQEDNNTEEDAQ